MALSPSTPLTRRLIAEGCKAPPRPPLTDTQMLLERIAEAQLPGTAIAFRRRVLAEAGEFIRAHHAHRSAAA